jgi:cation diffusion facilitator CzcD-associated flavoprotein CzcO
LVKSCVRLPSNDWEVTTIKNEKEHVEIFTDLVVCNGHHWEPKYPNYPGSFTGEFLHSHQYKKAAPFVNKKVLVIGGGNSACDVAVETSRVSAKTSISWRRGISNYTKVFNGEAYRCFCNKNDFSTHLPS